MPFLSKPTNINLSPNALSACATSNQWVHLADSKGVLYRMRQSAGGVAAKFPTRKGRIADLQALDDDRLLVRYSKGLVAMFSWDDSSLKFLPNRDYIAAWSDGTQIRALRGGAALETYDETFTCTESQKLKKFLHADFGPAGSLLGITKGTILRYAFDGQQANEDYRARVSEAFDFLKHFDAIWVVGAGDQYQLWADFSPRSLSASFQGRSIRQTCAASCGGMLLRGDRGDQIHLHRTLSQESRLVIQPGMDPKAAIEQALVEGHPSMARAQTIEVGSPLTTLGLTKTFAFAGTSKGTLVRYELRD